jgi:hypothetical protein
MDNREDSLLELYERIKANRTDLGLVSFKRTPTVPVDESEMPCLIMLEGTDSIIAHSSKNSSGYPVRRVLKVTLELIVTKDVAVKTLLKNLRRIVFTERGTDPPIYNARLLPSTRTGFIQETSTEGPTGYGLPNVLGMSLVLDLVYTDDVM